MKITPKKLTPEAINFLDPERVKGGWLYRCDGMPRLSGCGEEIIVSRQYTRTGMKASGWLVCFGTVDMEGTEDPDVGLVFCPSCALIVLGP